MVAHLQRGFSGTVSTDCNDHCVAQAGGCWYNLGHTFLALNDPHEAMGCFERALGFNDPRCHAAAQQGLAEARAAAK
jgi:hypothetical protein